MLRFSFHPSHQIGAGSSGVVYAGRVTSGLDERDRPVAIKVMHDSQVEAADSVARFTREARLGYELARHPNLIVTRAYGRTPEGCPYLVMDLEGPTLSSVQGQFRGDAPAVRSVIAAVCAALEHLAGYGVHHGDINPGNVFVSWDGVIKLGDYGRVRRDGDDRRALGLLLHELIAGRSPFRPHDDAIQPLPDDVEGDLRSIILGLLAPEGRGLTIADAARVLDALDRPRAGKDQLAATAASWRELHAYELVDDGDLVLLEAAEIVRHPEDTPDARPARLEDTPGAKSARLEDTPGAKSALLGPSRLRVKIALAAVFVLGVAAALLMLLGERSASVEPGDLAVADRVPVPELRRKDPDVLEVDVIPPIRYRREPPNERVDHPARESDGPRRIRRRAQPRDEGADRDTSDRSRLFHIGLGGKNKAGIKAIASLGTWVDADQARLNVTINNDSGTEYHVAIVQLFDADDQSVDVRVDYLERWVKRMPLHNRKIPKNVNARLALIIPRASKLSGQLLSLVISEPGNARRVVVRGIRWPDSPDAEHERR